MSNFAALVQAIQETHERFAVQAVRAVNTALTLRNWLIGYRIAEFELRGADRAAYGDHLLSDLSDALERLGVSNTGRRQLYQYLAFYRAYPQIVRTAPAQLPVQPERLLSELSYSHFELLVSLDDAPKRAFYARISRFATTEAFRPLVWAEMANGTCELLA